MRSAAFSLLVEMNEFQASEWYRGECENDADTLAPDNAILLKFAV